MVLTEFFNALFGPLMKASPLFAIVCVSVIISVVFSLLYRALIDKQKMKRVKSELKEMQEKMKKARETKNEKELKALFSNTMKLNNEMMVLTLKPMIVSMVLFFIVIPWFYSNYGDIEVKIIDGKGMLAIGGYGAENVTVSNEPSSAVLSFDFSAHAQKYSPGDKIVVADKTWAIAYNPDARGFFEKFRNEPPYGMLTLENVRFELPFYIPLVCSEIGWLGLYILVSIPVTMIIRKFLGVD